MNKTIAVTGASGHLGNVICRLLLEKGFRVKAMYNTRRDSLEGLPIELIQGDVLNKSDLAKLIDGCEIVINSAAIISINGDPTGMVFKTNTEGPRNVYDVAKEKGVKRIVHISSVHAVMEEPLNLPFDEKRTYKTATCFPYDYSKAQGEQIMLSNKANAAPEVVVLRPSCIIGPFDYKTSEFGKALLKFYHGKIPVMPEGGYNFIDVRDVAESVINAMEKGRNGEIYLATVKYYSMKELANTIEKVTGKKTPKNTLSFTVLKSLIPFISAYSKLTNTIPLFTTESINALKYGHPGMDNTKAITELGHRVRPFEESINEFFTWQKSIGKIK